MTAATTVISAATVAAVAGSQAGLAQRLVISDARGHSLTIDSGWHEIVGGCLTWLRQQGL